MKASIDEVYVELGMVPESDDWEPMEDYDSYYYGDKVIYALNEYMSDGKFYNSGTVTWY